MPIYEYRCASCRRKSTFLTRSVYAEVEAVCDRAIVLLNGEVRADARLAELAATDGAVLVLDGSAPDVSDDLQALDEVWTIEPAESTEGTAYRILGREHADLRPAVYALARERDWPVRELRRDLRTLERVFNDLVATSGDSDELQGEGSGEQVADDNDGDEVDVDDGRPDPSEDEEPEEER